MYRRILNENLTPAAYLQFRFVGLLVILASAAFPTFAQAQTSPSCAACEDSDTQFPEPEAMLLDAGHDPSRYSIFARWTETARDDSGLIVQGIRAVVQDGTGALDLYCTIDGHILDSQTLATFGILEKNWDAIPVQMQGNQPNRPASLPKIQPYSGQTTKTLQAPAQVWVDRPDLDALADDDTKSGQDGSKGPIRMGIHIPLEETVVLGETVASHGAWQILEDGSRLWSATLAADGAVGVRVHFAEARVPDGAQLSIYNEATPSEAYGPFPDSFQGPTDLWTPTCYGDRVTVECLIPDGVDPQGLIVIIDRIIYQYREHGSYAITKGIAGACNLDTTCYPEWAGASSAVAGIGIVSSVGTIFCTASLVVDTDTATDIPYLLTAYHCVSTQTKADTLEAYWFYQTPACDGTPPAIISVPRTVGGADFLVGSATDAGTDLSFLRLRNTPPPGVGQLGWSTLSEPTGADSICIHHPRGDFKRIAFGNVTDSSAGDPFYVDTCGSSQRLTANFYQSTWTDGTTEGGSSGSPLLNANQQIIGQLWGGYASCSLPDCPDYYGRFEVSYPLLESFLSPPPPPKVPSLTVPIFRRF
jgi:hypothetical protein